MYSQNSRVFKTRTNPAIGILTLELQTFLTNKIVLWLNRAAAETDFGERRANRTGGVAVLERTQTETGITNGGVSVITLDLI